AYSDWVCAQTVQPQLLHGVAPQGSAPPPAPPATPLSLHLVDGDAQHKQIGWSFPAGAGTPDWFSVYRDGALVGTTPSVLSLAYTYTDAFVVDNARSYTYTVCAAFRQGDRPAIENCSTTLKVESTLQRVGTPLPA